MPVHGTEINSGMEHANQSQHKSQKKVSLVLFVLTLRLVRAFRSAVDFRDTGLHVTWPVAFAAHARKT